MSKIKIKSLKELSDDWKNNWKKFTKGFNDFFGIPNNKKTASEHITKETAIDITPEDIIDVESTSESTSAPKLPVTKRTQSDQDSTS